MACAQCQRFDSCSCAAVAESKLALVASEVASIRGRYRHIVHLEDAVFQAFERIAKIVETS